MQVTTTQKKDLRTLLQSEGVKQQIALVLPKHLTADRMARVAITAVMRTPKLQQCRPESLLQSLMLCSQVGLEPDGRNAHLIPYGDQCQVIFDWKGLVALARRNGVKNIAADVVCEGDEFHWFRNAEGLQFTHRVDWKQKRGAVYAAYCIWKDGDQFDGEVMTREEIEGIRKRSRSGNAGPWVTDWAEMAKKTVIRRASKKWPLDPETASAMVADDDVLETAQPKPAVVSPLFAALPEPPEEAEPEPAPVSTSESDEDGDLGPVNTPAPTSTPDHLKEIAFKLKAIPALDAELLDYLRTTGAIDSSLSSLEEVAMMAPAALAKINAEMPAFRKALLKARKEGAK